MTPYDFDHESDVGANRVEARIVAAIDARRARERARAARPRRMRVELVARLADVVVAGRASR